MPPRKKSETVALNLRMKKSLRAKLERAAKNSGGSMNREIVERLAASLGKKSALYESFGGEKNFRFFRVLGFTVGTIESEAGTSWMEDEAMKINILRAMETLFRAMGVAIPSKEPTADIEETPGFYEFVREFIRRVDDGLDARGTGKRANGGA